MLCVNVCYCFSIVMQTILGHSRLYSLVDNENCPRGKLYPTSLNKLFLFLFKKPVKFVIGLLESHHQVVRGEMR